MSHPFTYLVSAELTDVGRRRKNNEDSVIRLPECGVFCVADGMGGAQGGEIASQAAVEALKAEFTTSPDAPFAVTAQSAARLTARALDQASLWIKHQAEERGLSGCGSTAVVLVFDRVTPSRARVLHAGDSRAYLFRGGSLTQLSVDHSVAVAAGVSDESALPAMFRGVITRAVGLENTVQLEQTPTDVRPNDLFLLCSDGLTKMVKDKLLQKLLHKRSAEPLETVAQALVDEALRAGGEDNVSVVLVRVGETLPSAPTMDVPAETLALEASVPAAPVAEAGGDDADAPTRETGQTADTAGSPSGFSAGATDDKGLPVTPATPFSGAGVTPHTPATGISSPNKIKPLAIGGLVLILLAGLVYLACRFLLPTT